MNPPAKTPPPGRKGPELTLPYGWAYYPAMRWGIDRLRSASGRGIPALGLILAAALLGSTGCGDVNSRDGLLAGFDYCQEISGTYHFQVLIPPWKYSKEYRCTNWQDRTCVGSWQATGRYIYVVSDQPFVNYDSEIISSLDIKITSGNTLTNANSLIQTENIGGAGSTAQFADSDVYPREVNTDVEGALPGHEVLWRQLRDFEGNAFNWYRRDVFLSGGGVVYHLQFFSIDSMDKPEFDAILSTFRLGPAPDDAPNCTCVDEHDPSGSQDC